MDTLSLTKEARIYNGEYTVYELLQILKDDVVKVLHSICQQIWKTEQWPQDWKRSVSIPVPKKGNAKECSNYLTSVLAQLFEHPLALPFFGIGMKTDLFQSCGHC